MKKQWKTTLALGAILSLSLAGCGQDATKALIGNWQAEVDMTDQLNEELASDPETAAYIDIDRFVLKLDFSLQEGGTYTLSMNQDSVTQAVNDVKDSLKEGLGAYMQASLQEQGSDMTLEEALALSGLDLNSMIDTLFDELMNEEDIGFSFEELSQSGNYTVKDGKIYLLDEGETKASEDSHYFTYELSGSDLKVTGTEEDDEEWQDMLPLVFQKQ